MKKIISLNLIIIKENLPKKTLEILGYCINGMDNLKNLYMSISSDVSISD